MKIDFLVMKGKRCNATQTQNHVGSPRRPVLVYLIPKTSLMYLKDVFMEV